jgi:GTPase-associated protein 1, N-terminal domain type 2
MRLEQAIFTSVRGARLDGYQLAAASPGINSQLAKELTGWGPAHDSLWSVEPGAKSVNFHRLSEELFCVSQTSIAGAEYSGRGGGRVYTQMLVVPGEVLARFAGDPFQIIQAVSASGRMLIHEQLPDSLPTIPLLGRGSELGPSTAADLICRIRAETLAELTEVLASNWSMTVVTNLPVPRLFQAVLQQLSLSERMEISFSTGLRPSSRRPFKLSIAPNDPALARQSQRISGGRIIEVLAEEQAAIGLRTARAAGK